MSLAMPLKMQHVAKYCNKLLCLCKHDIRYSHVGIFLFPRHCIFYFAILKFLSIRIQNADVAYIFKMLRWNARNKCQSKFKSRATCEPLTRNAKCNYLKNDRTQQNESNSITVFMLQDYISLLLELVIMCIAYELYIVNRIC